MPEKGDNFFKDSDNAEARQQRSLTSRVLYGESNKDILQNPEYQLALPRLRELYGQAWRWHGTGRYHHHDDTVIDVLGEIIGQDGLVPHEDIYDYTRGVSHSTSTSKTRTYATLYAQLHFEWGKRLRNPLQTKVAWFYYLGSTAIEAAKHDPRLFSKKFREQINLSKKGSEHFHKKYTKGKVLGKDMMQGGVSDISGNYPILIGIREGAFQEAAIAPVLRKHESRSEAPISLTEFTHIEVPTDKVQEVSDLLQAKGKGDVPIFPIEWGEEFCKSLPQSFLKDGVPLKK